MTRFPSAVMPERPHAVEREAPTSPAELFAVLWRRRLWIALGTLAGLIAAVAFLALVTPRYMAVAQLLIDPNDLRVMDNAVTPSNTLNEAATAYVESQARVLTSDTVLRKVIEQQKLEKDPEFAQPPSALRAALTLVQTRLGLATQRDPDPVVAVLQELAPKIGARRQERTYVVDLTASTRDPEKSARIANAIVTAYLEDQADARTTAAKRATEALSGRLQELKDRVREAENQAETFKAQNNLVSASGQLVSEQQLSELTNQLTAAGAKADEAKARLDQIDILRRGKADAGAIAEAVQSQTVAALRAQHAEVLRRKAELTARLGERHPSIADINAQAHDLQQLIDREVARLAQAARGDYERAQATRQALLTRLNGLKQDAVTTNQALVRLRELEREVEASRAVYQAFLTRSRETSEQERVNTTNVRVLSEANVPNKRAFPPRTLIVLALALMFGAAAGAGAGFARDWTDDRIHTRRDLEAACSVPILAEIAALPDESGPRGWWPWLRAKIRAWRHGTTVMATLLDAPNSDFAAGIHRLRYMLRTAATNATPTILFLAPGKPGARSDVSLNLGLAAASGGSRTLLVDTDFKRRDLSSRVVGGSGAGLLDVANDGAKLEQALIAESETGLLVLQAGRGASGNWHSSPESIRRALDQARGSYTMIVDGPSDPSDPLATVLAASADFVVLVVTTGVTRAREISDFQHSPDFPVGKVRGVVLVSGTGASL
ncbi:MAG: GNVR domain-containing protein [Alphaproteobacteria bacterium]